MRHRGFEPRTTWLKVKCSTDWANGSLAGVVGFEPTHDGVRVRCLTAWRYPYGSWSRVRTCDIVINSHALYRLSYSGIYSTSSRMILTMERKTGLEPATPTLARLCSTTELLPHWRPGSDLNWRSPPWQGGMLDHYTTGPHVSYLISIPTIRLFVKGMMTFVIYG